jgi:AAA domain
MLKTKMVTSYPFLPSLNGKISINSPHPVSETIKENNMQIRKAERRKAKLRLGLVGVSGAGKTYSSLILAKGLGGKVCIIDTESRSADLYANEFDYDVLELAPPFSPLKYIEAIKLCEKSGYDIIIVDSLTHAWAGEGGALDLHTDVIRAQKGVKNSYTAWRDVTPIHNKLINAILQSPSHIIVTMRSKTHHDLQENEHGKKVPVKIGLAPVQREGMDFEFTVVLDISSDHYASSSKDRTRLFDGKNFMIGEQTGKELLEWLNYGKEEEVPVMTTDLLSNIPLSAIGLSGTPFTEEDDAEIITILSHFSELMKSSENLDDLKHDFEEGWRALLKYKGFDQGRSALNNLKSKYDMKKEEINQ